MAEPKSALKAGLQTGSDPAPLSPGAAKAAAVAAARAEASPFLVQIGQVYEGPFDLLLDLIRRQNINVYDIPISAITAEYLLYLKSLQQMDVEVAAEFLVVAATLIQIKSKMMLPADPVLPGEAPVDPREELVQRLIEYEKFKQAASLLHERQQLEEASWCRPGMLDYRDEEGLDGQVAVGVYDLVATLQQMMRRLEERPRFEIIREQVSVREMMEHLHRLLAHTDDPVAIRAVFQRAESKTALLAIFLAVLELVRMNVAVMRQDRPFGEILLKRHRRFKEAWDEVAAYEPAVPGPAPTAVDLAPTLAPVPAPAPEGNS